ncbi:MAG: UvrD-helicase domain-containing protein [Planctomycetes bacterium]|nr:UvrD-helicase domain-containing protein [Planctomycetota bacterium]MBI3834074.1 UvrD-helicase domain-containing protein [Planctomycetota bacterium]
MTSNHTSSFTDEQLRAIRTVGRSVIVSAAAGSGKTAVLAERCAYLICDAPSPFRCDADSLLVLTFTEAAATEMRSRVIDALRRRVGENPQDERLHRQMTLLEVAQISTIHSFCLWLIRRWFPHLDVDATATVLDAEEAVTLRREVAIEVFRKRYEANASDDDLLGASELSGIAHADATGNSHRGPQSNAFRRLVDDYGLGEDTELVQLVIDIGEFVGSLSDPEQWMNEASLTRDDQIVTVVHSVIGDLCKELRLQLEHCAGLLRSWSKLGGFAVPYRERVGKYQAAIESWASQLNAVREGSSERMQAFDAVVGEIETFEFERLSSRKESLSRGETTAKKSVNEAYKDARDRLFKRRLKARFCENSAGLVDGIRRVAPFAATIIELVREFRAAYSTRKRRMNVLDFTDLERFAFQLLCANPVQDRKAAPSEIARSLHKRFAHVLVDEFQDINPIQKEILHLASRESVDPMSGNLFVVGDVKQSIYRFRLAEPRIFLERLHDFQQSGGEVLNVADTRRLPQGEAILLTKNFRSRPTIIKAVNEVFRQLMTGGEGELCYDRNAELRAARDASKDGFTNRVEVHVLERSMTPISDEENGEEAEEDTSLGGERSGASSRIGLSDPALWSVMEREGRVIGTRIRDWLDRGIRKDNGELLAYSDIAVLLRSAKVNAERVASRLSRVGIPTFAQVGGSLLSALEVREVIAALTVLDNAQQDIPLAATLRTGVFGDRFDENDLVELRLLDRQAPFHQAVRDYAERGPSGELRARVATTLRRIDQLREDARRSTVADTISRIYGERGYMAMACAMRNGSQRRGNLLKFHDLARKFSTFRRQGLHRFLSFLESANDAEQQIDYAAPLGAAENVVRVMTIHQAKGLEFPVVFLAGLGNQFNLGDRRGRAIFERRAHLGLKVVDSQRMIEYPSAAHRLVSAEVERATRDEELRVLYVAMTRAREKLVLVGSTHATVEIKDSAFGNERASQTLQSELDIASARAPMDWLAAIVTNSVRRGRDGAEAIASVFDLHVHLATNMQGWDTNENGSNDDGVRFAISRLEPLPDSEPRAKGDAMVEATLSRLDRAYPFAASSSLPATLAASQIKTGFDFLARADEQTPRSASAKYDFRRPRPKYADSDADDSVHRGIVTHTFLQWADYEAAARPDGVSSEIQRLVAGGRFSARDAELLPLDPLTWFMTTPLADAIRTAGERYRREFPFVVTDPLQVLDPTVAAPADDRILVRGIIDGILPCDGGIELVDFKTDKVTTDGVERLAEQYRSQMTTYARVMTKLWRQPVRACRLVFLSAKTIHCLEIEPSDINV